MQIGGFLLDPARLIIGVLAVFLGFVIAAALRSGRFPARYGPGIFRDTQPVRYWTTTVFCAGLTAFAAAGALGLY
jgi:hypothetical protein